MFANTNNNRVRPILYYDDINPHSRAVLMILNMLDADIELRPVEMIKGEHLKPTYAKINPARTVPTMEHKDLIITDNAIFAYICENHDNEKAQQLIGFKCYKRHCRVLSRLFFESQVLHRIHGQLMTDLVRKTIAETDIEYHQKKVEHAYDVMETYLKDGPYMAGSVLTAADISFVACLGALDMMFPIDVDLSRWGKLNDWFRRMRSLPVQKINTNGIEKQRRIVEHYAKFQFVSDARRFTKGVRESLIPRFSLSHARCSVGVQTIGSEKVNTIEERSSVDTSYKDILVERNARDLEYQISERTPVIENSLDVPPTDVAVQSLGSDTNPQGTLLDPATLSNPLDLNPTETVAPTQFEVSNLSERSSGGAHKEKPIVPPKLKRIRTIIMMPPNSAITRADEETAEPRKDVVAEPQNATSDNCCATTRNSIIKCRTPEMKKICLSRLNGGVEPVVPPKMPQHNELLIQPARSIPLTPIKNSTDLSRDLKTPSLKIPTAVEPPIAINSPKTSSETLGKNKPTKIPALPPGLPINSPQVALQYSRRPHAPNAALPAPPPTPENSSQEERNDFEFPPPPSELLIQNQGSHEKVSHALKLHETNKTIAEPVTRTVTRTVSKKSSAFKSETVNTKVTAESASRTMAKKSGDFKPLPGKKNTANESKECKPARKTKNSLLLASGTKSPCSNISQASLTKDKLRKVQKMLNVTNTMQRLIAVTTTKKPQDKKIRKLEKSSSIKIVASSASSVNASKKISGRSLISSGPTELNSKSIPKGRRAEGGGQWRSKEKSLSLAANTQTKLLNAVLNEAINIEAKPAGTSAEKGQITEISSAKPQQKSTPNPVKASPKIPVKPVKKEMKPANQRLNAKNKVKVYPTKTAGRNQTKTTKIFDTSPYILGVSSNSNQPKLEAAKRPITKMKKKRGSKAASEEVLNISQSLPLKTPCASVPKLEYVVAQSTVEPTATTEIPTLENVTSEPTPEKPLPSSEIVTDNRNLQTAIETTNVSPTTITASTSSPNKPKFSAVKDVPVSVGLVAKALQTLSTATPNSCPISNNIVKALPPQPPPMPPPPPPVPFHLQLPPPPPPPSPPNVSRGDALPEAGTVAKALQSLGAVTAEASPLCGTAKPLRKIALKVKNFKEAISSLVNSKTQNQTMTRIAEEPVHPLPLADILKATVQHMNKNKVDTPNETNLTFETQQSVAKTQNLSDKTVGNMAQEAGEETTATNIKQMTDTVLLDVPFTTPFALNEVNSGTDQGLVSPKELNIVVEEKKCDTEAQHNGGSLGPPVSMEPSLALAPLVKAEPIEVIMPQRKASNSLISDAPETVKCCSSSAACTDATNLSDSTDRQPPTQITETTTKSPENNRSVIQRALISEGIVVLEPTPLPAQPNIIITGYTRTEPTTVDPLLSGVGRAPLGNTIAHTLRVQSAGPCSHGPSANVVISPVGYTPTSDFDSKPEQLLPIRVKYIAPPPPPLPPPPPSTPPLPLTAIKTTAIADKPSQQHPSEIPVRALSPRLREERPYPTAHRSRRQRVGEQKTINRGRVM